MIVILFVARLCIPRFDTVFKILENKVSEVESQEAKPKRSITKKAGDVPIASASHL